MVNSTSSIFRLVRSRIWQWLNIKYRSRNSTIIISIIYGHEFATGTSTTAINHHDRHSRQTKQTNRNLPFWKNQSPFTAWKNWRSIFASQFDTHQTRQLLAFRKFTLGRERKLNRKLVRFRLAHVRPRERKNASWKN